MSVIPKAGPVRAAAAAPGAAFFHRLMALIGGTLMGQLMGGTLVL